MPEIPAPSASISFTVNASLVIQIVRALSVGYVARENSPASSVKWKLFQKLEKMIRKEILP